jgi:hypothetical protein
VEVKKEGILNNVELRYKNEPARTNCSTWWVT